MSVTILATHGVGLCTIRVTAGVAVKVEWTVTVTVAAIIEKMHAGEEMAPYMLKSLHGTNRR